MNYSPMVVARLSKLARELEDAKTEMEEIMSELPDDHREEGSEMLREICDLRRMVGADLALAAAQEAIR